MGSIVRMWPKGGISLAQSEGKVEGTLPNYCLPAHFGLTLANATVLSHSFIFWLEPIFENLVSVRVYRCIALRGVHADRSNDGDKS